MRPPAEPSAVNDAAQNQQPEAMPPIAPPAADVRLYLIDDEGLLFDPNRQRLLGLNTAAALVWCGLESGWSSYHLCHQYATIFSVPLTEAVTAVNRVATTFAELGLLDLDSSQPASDRSSGRTEGGAPAPLARMVPAMAMGKKAISRARATYRILGQSYAVGFGSRDAFGRAHPPLAQFAQPVTPTTAIPVMVVAGNPGFVITIDGQETDRADDLLGLAPQLKSALVMDAINRHGFAFFLHSAVLRCGDQALLLPAAPGSGKTCLSLALARAGFAYLTDEVAVLEPGHLAVRGVSVSPCVKKPAWPVIRGLYPDIDDVPPHRRMDGKTVKYLPPPVDPADPALSQEWPVRWLVFPRYEAGSVSELLPLSRVEGLRRLLEECLAMRAPLTHGLVQRLVGWIGGIDCYTLRFNGFDDAVRLIKAACQRSPAPAAP